MNIIKHVPNGITSRFGRTILVTQKHSPTILFAAGVVGVGATVVLACKSTLKLESLLDVAEKDLRDAKRIKSEIETGKRKVEKDEDYTHIEAAIRARLAFRIAKLYAPAIGVGVLSIGALTGAHTILSKRNVALTAAYAALDRGFRDYRSRVVEEFGEDKDRELRYSSEKQTIVEEQPSGQMKKIEVTRVGPGEPSIYAKFFDEYCESWSPNPEYNRVFLQNKQNFATDLLRARGHVFLNEVYDDLGIERTAAGSVVGWILEPGGDNFVDFGVFRRNNQGAIDFVNGRDHSILLDFNVDGVIYDKIEKKNRELQTNWKKRK